MSDVSERVSDERLALLISLWEAAFREQSGCTVDGAEAEQIHSALTELQSLRSSTLAANRVVTDEMVEAAARAIAGTAWEGIYFTTRSREQYMDDCWREHETDARTALTAALRAVQPSIAGEAIPRSEWGCELWEILFGLLKGAVPDELTDEVLQRLAEDFMSALSSKDNGDGK